MLQTLHRTSAESQMNNFVLPDTPRQLRLALALRLGVGAVAIGILAGGIAYWAASYEAELRVKELAIAGVRHFESPAMRASGTNPTPR